MAVSDPIGIFDSGVGGLSVWKEINTRMPNEHTVYLADSANAPYGEKSCEEIIRLSVKNTERLLAFGAKIIVVACNTATTNAIAYLRATYAVKFIGIEPATKPAAIATKTGKIGILATKGTLASELFLNTSKQFRGDVEIIETIGTGLVQAIESGQMEEARPLLESYIRPMVEKGVDNIVLGCTHYPFLIPLIREMVPPAVEILDSGQAVARQCQRVMEENGLCTDAHTPGNHRFFTNADPALLAQFAELVAARPSDTGFLAF